MTDRGGFGSSWLHQSGRLLLGLILVALGARLVWELLLPLIPVLVGLLVGVGAIWWWRSRRQW